MGNVQSLAAYRRVEPALKVDHVVEMMQEMGGEAHATLLFSRLLACDLRRKNTMTPGDLDRLMVRHEVSDRTGTAALFERVFGPSSNRWRLTNVCEASRSIGA